MNIAGHNSLAPCAVYPQNDKIGKSVKVASGTNSSTKVTDSKTSGDVVSISQEARQAAMPSSSPAAYSFSTVRTFTLPSGVEATLGTTLNENGETVAQLSYTDKDSVQHNIFLDKTSTLRLNEKGEIEVIPYDNSADTTEKAALGGISKVITLQDIMDGVEKIIKNIQGSDADEIFILLPSNTQDAMWNMDAGNGNNVIVDLSGEEVAVRTGNGNDTIIGVGGLGYQVDSGDGDDSIELDGIFIVNTNAGSGNDTITLKGGSIMRVWGGDGDDTVNITATGSMMDTISGGAGSDNMTLNGDVFHAKVYGDGPDAQATGDDTITVHGNMILSELHTGNGSNSVYVQNASTSYIAGGNGNDSISAGNIHATEIDGGDGDDAVKADHISESVIVGGGGNNTISVVATSSYWGRNNEIYGGRRQRTAEATDAEGKEIVSSDFDWLAVTGRGIQPGTPENQGDGNNTIIVGEASTTRIYGGSGDDSITVNKANERTRIDGGDGDDELTVNFLDSSVIIGGSGDNILDVQHAVNSEIYGGSQPAAANKKVDDDKKEDDDDKEEEEKKLSEFEQATADAAMGIKKGATTTVVNDGITFLEEEPVALAQEEQAFESALSAQNEKFIAAQRYSGKYNSGASSHRATRFSMTI